MKTQHYSTAKLSVKDAFRPGRSIRCLVLGDAAGNALACFADGGWSLGDNAVLEHCRHLVGGKRRFDAKALREIPSPAALVKARRYGLILIRPLAWARARYEIGRWSPFEMVL